MRSNVWNIQSRSDISIETGRWLNIGSGHDFLVIIVFIDVIDSHGNVVARSNVPLWPDMKIAERRQAFQWQAGYGIMDVGYAEVVAHSLSGNVPGEKVVSDSR